MFELTGNHDPSNDHRQSEAGHIRVLLAAPRGFCAGVIRAIAAVRDALEKHGAPVYVRRPIVHNLEVVRQLEREGAVFVEELEEVPAGSVVVFSAHGVPPAVAREASLRGLFAFDAVCPLVSKVHREVERHQRDGRVMILIGHEGHPEMVGTIGHAIAGSSFIVGNPGQVEDLPLGPDTPAAYAVQTTYAVDEAQQIVEALRAKFSDLAEPSSSDICYATTNRQAAVRAIASQSDAVIVVGAPFSSNARRLAEVASRTCANVQLVAIPTDVDWGLIPLSGTVGISAAASTPEGSVTAIIDALSDRLEVTVEEVETVIERAIFKPLEIS